MVDRHDPVIHEVKLNGWFGLDVSRQPRSKHGHGELPTQCLHGPLCLGPHVSVGLSIAFVHCVRCWEGSWGNVCWYLILLLQKTHKEGEKTR